MSSIHPVLLVTLSIPILSALWIAWRKHQRAYILGAFFMEVVFCGVYLYIAVFNPTIEMAREVARTGFVFMQSVGATFSIFYLVKVWRDGIST